jgi:hypothetical protein
MIVPMRGSRIYDSYVYDGAGYVGLHYESGHLHCSLNPARPIRMSEIPLDLHFYLSIYTFIYLFTFLARSAPSPRPELYHTARPLVGKAAIVA